MVERSSKSDHQTKKEVKWPFLNELSIKALVRNHFLGKNMNDSTSHNSNQSKFNNIHRAIDVLQMVVSRRKNLESIVNDLTNSLTPEELETLSQSEKFNDLTYRAIIHHAKLSGKEEEEKAIQQVLFSLMSDYRLKRRGAQVIAAGVILPFYVLNTSVETMIPHEMLERISKIIPPVFLPFALYTLLRIIYALSIGRGLFEAQFEAGIADKHLAKTTLEIIEKNKNFIDPSITVETSEKAIEAAVRSKHIELLWGLGQEIGIVASTLITGKIAESIASISTLAALRVFMKAGEKLTLRKQSITEQVNTIDPDEKDWVKSNEYSIDEEMRQYQVLLNQIKSAVIGKDFGALIGSIMQQLSNNTTGGILYGLTVMAGMEVQRSQKTIDEPISKKNVEIFNSMLAKSILQMERKKERPEIVNDQHWKQMEKTIGLLIFELTTITSGVNKQTFQKFVDTQLSFE